MHKSYFTKPALALIFCLSFCLPNVLAQTQDTALYNPFSPSLRPRYHDSLPEFVKMTLTANPNVYAVEQAFEVFEKAEKLKRKQRGEDIENIYEVYYHRWRRAYEPYIQADGSIVLPTLAAYKTKVQESTRARALTRELSSLRGVSNWSCVGPKETYWLKDDNTNQPPAPWQANVYAFDISKSNTSILYCGTETGAVFKTIDKGLNWTVCGNNVDFTSAPTAIEIHPTNPNIVYVGSGAALFKTVDGGNTWSDLTNCAGVDPHDIAIVPSNPDIVMASFDNGFFRSTDGGSTWTQIYTQACYDIEINPTDDTHVFILKSNGTNLQFFKSVNSGVSFTAKNLPLSTLYTGRLTVSAADGNRIYALCLGTSNAPSLLKSADEGETWTVLSANYCTGGISDAAGGQGFYDLSINASPTNANQIIFGMCSTSKANSTDGGNTYTYSHIGGYCGSFAIHPDLQEVKSVINGGAVETWVATDGGLTLSTDFFTNTNNASARINGIFATDFWGYGQGWNEDIMIGGRYHNGNTALADFYPAGKALRMGGAEQGTGYVLHGSSRYTIFSDLGDGWILPKDFNSNSDGRFPYSKYPNEDGYGFDATNLVIDPVYYTHHYVGEGNVLWKTTNNGASFSSLYDFGSRVRRLDISRSNPNVLYLATNTGFYKSTNRGSAWTTIALPPSRSGSNLYLAIHPTNEQEVWIGFKNISGTSLGKVYRSTNGGTTWTDMTTTALNGLKIKDIIHTGSDIYIAADGNKGRVFYRGINETNWTDFSNNLPTSMNILRMLPFYRDGKLRVAGNRGIWETPLHSNTLPIAQPFVNKNTTNCTRDTFLFDDYSILDHNGATWAWSFSPTPQYISSATVRNPKVVFAVAGNFSASLTVTNIYGTSTKTMTNMVSVNATNECDVSNTNLNALSLTVNGDHSHTPPLDLGSNTNQITVMAWVKPNGNQSSYSSILCAGNTILNLRDNNELGLHWNGSQWWWSTGLIVQPEEWSHVALVADGTTLRLYLNGKAAVNTTVPAQVNLSNISWDIGMQTGWTNRTFKGLIDEACFYNRALSQNEIREQMHLIKNPATDPSLKGYFQFDEINGIAWNKAASASYGTLTGSATRTASTAPIGVGTSQRMSITTGGIKDFPNQHISLIFPNSGTLPNGEIVVTELNAAPDQKPANGFALNTRYWIINNPNPSANTTFTPLSNISFNNLGSFANGNASNYTLYKRKTGQDGATWGTTLGSASTLTATNNNTLTFGSSTNITSFSQFALNNEAIPILSATTLSNTCPIKTVNLNNLVTSTTPSGARLRWHTVAANPTIADSVATPSVLTTAGTYYAYYFDATNGYYSPPTAAVTVTITSSCAATFTFNCGTAATTGTFVANGTAGQTGSVTVPITGATAGSATFRITGTGFTGTLATTLTAGQTSVSVPISYDGTGAARSQALTIASSEGTDACTPSVSVLGVPDLTTTIGQPLTPLTVGQASDLPITVTNTGNGAAPGIITATITLPTGVTAPPTFTNNGWTCSTSAPTVTCTNSGPIAAGASSTFNMPVTPTISVLGTKPIFNGSTNPVTGETNTGNNNATPLTPATNVLPANCDWIQSVIAK